MKLNLKILTIFFVILLFSVVFYSNEILAVGRVSQGWKIIRKDKTEPDLLYRTYASPNDGSIQRHTNAKSTDYITGFNFINSYGNEAPAKWEYNIGIIPPTYESYTTSKLVFHDKMYCNYSKTGNDWSYNLATSEPVGIDMQTMLNAVKNSKQQKTTPVKVSGVKELYSITRIGGVYGKMWENKGTGIKLSKVYIGKRTSYREALIKLEGSSSNIYVIDNIVYSEDLPGLINALNGATRCFVSGELISGTYDNDGSCEVSKTAVDFLNQHDKKWSSETMGKTDKALGSVLNLYDNELIFPNSTQRKVYIKHINIGTGDTIDLTKVNSGKKITPPNDQKYILVNNNKTTSSKTYSGYQEYYEGISVTSQVVKKALQIEKIECLGYNMKIASDLSSAQNQITASVRQGKYTKSDVATAAGKNQSSNDDVIVIEFYYKTKEEIVSPPDTTDEPDKYVEGQVFVQSNINREGECVDTKDNYSIVSIPSGSTATVGIQGIPQYMAGAIKLEENIQSKTFNLQVKLSAGPHSKTMYYTFNYTPIYYNITDMLIYKLNKINLYDAGKGHAGTIGDTMFNWANGIFTDTSLVKNPTVKLLGLNNKTINNTTADIQNSLNYYNVVLSSTLGGGDITSLASKTLTKNYISQDKWNKIDINKDNAISSADKTYAQEQVNVTYEAKQTAASNLEKYKIALELATKTKKTAEDNKNKLYSEFITKYLTEPTQEYVNKVYEQKISYCDSWGTCNGSCISGGNTNCENYCILEKSMCDMYSNKYTEVQAKYYAYEDAMDFYKTAKSKYDTALSNVNSAQQAYDSAVSQYNAAVDKNKYLLENYDECLKLYQTYMSLNTSTKIATEFSIKATVKVKNMQVTIDNYNLHNKNTTVSQEIPFTSLSKIYVISTEKPVIEETKYYNLTTSIKRSAYKNSNKIDKSVLNGVRGLVGSTEYKTDIIIGESTDKVQDNVFNTDGKLFSVVKNKLFTKQFKVNTKATTVKEKYKEVLPINVYTPITVKSSVDADENFIVDQTTGGFTAPLIQINTPFTITITNNAKESVYGLPNTTEYNMGSYIKFDFDVHKVKIGGKLYKNGEKINAGTWIGFLAGNNIKVTAQAYGSMEDDELSLVTDEKSSYTVRSVAYNATEFMRNTARLYPTLEDLMNSDTKDLVDNICSHPSYFDEETNEVIIINRMYGFRVTDVKDIEWKNTFRKNLGSSVNLHTGNVYYAGITKWDTTATSKVNKISRRTVSEIGKNPLRILPIGPYKNTDVTKINAPKLGYRFSYDLKVTGSYYNSKGEIRKDKTVDIATKFYYISKDGKTFIEESTGKNGIYLFYKNKNGEYVKIDSNGGGYELKYTPDDGYRYIEGSTTEDMSKTPVSIGNLRNITLKYNMAAPATNRASITYYGDYKLPNSTIAVKVNSNGKYDINNPLTDGYIGVIFDISSVAGKVTENGIEKSVILRYGQNTKEDSNTSQWDYEGYLGFTNYGNKVKTGELHLQLEDGTWQITDTIYNKIKGTVILYDIDQRAATDYE